MEEARAGWQRLSAVNVLRALQAHLGMLPGLRGWRRAGDGAGTPQAGAVRAAFSASRAAAPSGEENLLGKEKCCGCFDRSRKLPAKTLSAHSVTAAQLIATSLARSHLISEASC